MGFSMLNFMIQDGLSELLDNLRGQGHATDVVQHLQGFVVSVDVQLSVVFPFSGRLRDHAYHPDASEDMVGMGVGDVEVVDLF